MEFQTFEYFESGENTTITSFTHHPREKESMNNKNQNSDAYKCTLCQNTGMAFLLPCGIASITGQKNFPNSQKTEPD